jgi:hypothetical protein
MTSVPFHPDRLALILVHFKGASAFGQLLGLQINSEQLLLCTPLGKQAGHCIEAPGAGRMWSP